SCVARAYAASCGRSSAMGSASIRARIASIAADATWRALRTVATGAASMSMAGFAFGARASHCEQFFCDVCMAKRSRSNNARAGVEKRTQSARTGAMEWWQALILGLVEGLTEYLPVSSTGHLLVVQRLLGIAEGEAANAYAIAIQAGAIAAVLGLYRSRVAQLGLGLLGRHEEGAHLVRVLLLAFLPAAVFGVAFDD